ncbi:MAG: hypothetical protein BMS9Abin36_1706 [Gammaproteobacteria bacterium]|nr:MAG: hypothetical protein BMS9Abin36_1706 [Gammaproteobacteria bacterium]
MPNALRLTVLLLTALTINTPVVAEIEIGGYYKNLFVSSRTLSLFPPAESYLLDLNRLRVKLDGNLGDRTSFDIQYDNEVLLGDYLGTTQFSAIKDLQPDTYFALERNYIDSENLYASHRLYRAYVTLAFPEADLRVGRQRIAWGTAMLWNPMDLLNPFNPIQLEREERQGIDAALLDWNYDVLSRVSLVYARQRSGSSAAARWRTNQKGFDLSFMAGRFRDDTVAGFDFSGQVGNIGVKGEITRTDMADEDSFIRAVVGADYTFANTLSLNLELYFNGQGSPDTAGYDFSRLVTGEVQSLARRYVGGYLGYDITPLLRWDNYLIFNLDDDSVFLAPNLAYSLSDNMEVTAGVQAFNGDPGTEYGTLENLYYLQFQLFF